MTYKIGGSGVIDITDGVHTKNQHSIDLKGERKKVFTLQEITVTAVCVNCMNSVFNVCNKFFMFSFVCLLFFLDNINTCNYNIGLTMTLIDNVDKRSVFPTDTDYRRSQTICFEFNEMILKEMEFITPNYCDGDIFEIHFYRHLMKNGKRK